MGKVEAYRAQLQTMDSWDDFLLRESRLPGPRANLELAYAVAEGGSEELFLRFAALGPEEAPQNTAAEFLAFCGVLGLGYLAARGGCEHFSLLRQRAADPRWRIREAVALGLQQYGRSSIIQLLALMTDWSQGTLLERRAVVATLCEPDLLQDADDAGRIMEILDQITASILDQDDRRAEALKVLRKALAYGWSVAVAAQPETGKPRLARWIACPDPDIRWIMRQNLKKKRLLRMDAVWTQAQLDTLNSG
ncbi:MAG: hypothetical protein ACK2UH_09520 [Candidatus Promineifilaceae bacterium]|jgi:hypothetical protein